ncbi:hypothetical protein cgR_0333 [Corynebacterium glutamicum R]|uniref:Uncharacterized protein n=1 Tax=Corynebacterium glutamicum (strain R) TaxID=340322 RepID=A0AB72V7P3_CORGB|nr:hypothetical protein cgR_0333 [Corynebacterium glutamicum R]
MRAYPPMVDRPSFDFEAIERKLARQQIRNSQGHCSGTNGGGAESNGKETSGALNCSFDLRSLSSRQEAQQIGDFLWKLDPRAEVGGTSSRASFLCASDSSATSQGGGSDCNCCD